MITNEAVTGSYVPIGKAGMLIEALVELTTVRPWSPTPLFTGSIVTEFVPAVIDWNAARLPGKTSVTVITGVQTVGSTPVWASARA